MKNKLMVAWALLLMTFANGVYAQDWPQFLGFERNNSSPQKKNHRT